jgi:hypothetical protein
MAKIALHITSLETASLPQENQDSRRMAFQSFMKRRKAAPADYTNSDIPAVSPHELLSLLAQHNYP